MENSEKQNRIQLLGELIKCGANIYLWKYDEYGNLLEADSNLLVLDTIFQHSSSKAYMLENAKKYTAPLIMGSDLGLIWCAVFDHSGDHSFLYVLGPVFHSEISTQTILQSAKEYQLDLSLRDRYVNLLSSLPVVSSILFFQHALTAHYLINGQKLNRSDLHFQAWPSEHCEASDALKKDRMHVWLAERALLSMIREGDLNYKDAMNQANMISGGIHSGNKNPLLHAMISCTGFTSLCVREAIQAGISPETAYSVGDKYIQSMTEATNVSELVALNHAMYEDFIMRVHKHRTNPKTSPQVQACRDYIELHVDQDLSLEILAERVGYSEYHLSRKFKQEMGVSIRTYIRYAKIERAKYLLETTSDSISQIAEHLRFCSSSHLSTAFQEVVGQKPQQYRLEHQKI